MNVKSKKKKIPWGQYIAVLFYMLAGAVCGWTMTSYVLTENGRPLSERFLYIIFILIFLYIGMFLQIIIHEMEESDSGDFLLRALPDSV